MQLPCIPSDGFVEENDSEGRYVTTHGGGGAIVAARKVYGVGLEKLESENTRVVAVGGICGWHAASALLQHPVKFQKLYL